MAPDWRASKSSWLVRWRVTHVWLPLFYAVREIERPGGCHRKKKSHPNAGECRRILSKQPPCLSDSLTKPERRPETTLHRMTESIAKEPNKMPLWHHHQLQYAFAHADDGFCMQDKINVVADLICEIIFGTNRPSYRPCILLALSFASFSLSAWCKRRHYSRCSHYNCQPRRRIEA